jgi:hypothetical protein
MSARCVPDAASLAGPRRHQRTARNCTRRPRAANSGQAWTRCWLAPRLTQWRHRARREHGQSTTRTSWLHSRPSRASQRSRVGRPRRRHGIHVQDVMRRTAGHGIHVQDVGRPAPGRGIHVQRVGQSAPGRGIHVQRVGQSAPGRGIHVQDVGRMSIGAWSPRPRPGRMPCRAWSPGYAARSLVVSRLFATRVASAASDPPGEPGARRRSPLRGILSIAARAFAPATMSCRSCNVVTRSPPRRTVSAPADCVLSGGLPGTQNKYRRPVIWRRCKPLPAAQ